MKSLNNHLQVVSNLEIEKNDDWTLRPAEGVEFVLTEPAALLVAQRRGDFVSLQPGADARQVVLIDERQTVGLERTAEIDGDDRIGLIIRNGVHLDGQGAVVTIGLEGESDFSTIVLERFHVKTGFGFHLQRSSRSYPKG